MSLVYDEMLGTGAKAMSGYEELIGRQAVEFAERIERTARLQKATNPFSNGGVRDCASPSYIAVISCFYDFEAKRLVEMLRGAATALEAAQRERDEAMDRLGRINKACEAWGNDTFDAREAIVLIEREFDRSVEQASVTKQDA